MFNKSTLNHRNDAMMVKCVFLFLACTILLETSREIVIKTFSVIMNIKQHFDIISMDMVDNSTDRGKVLLIYFFVLNCGLVETHSIIL